MDEETRHPVDDYRLSDGTYMLDGRVVTDRDTAVSMLEELRAETEPQREAREPFWPATEWFFVMRMVKEEDRHPSNGHLARIIREHGVPDFAQEYVASRIGQGPGSRSFREPEDWAMFGRFRAKQAAALMDLTHLSAALFECEPQSPPRPGPDGTIYQKIETESLLPLAPDDPSCTEVEVQMRWNGSRARWEVARAKQQALEIVARRYDMKVETLRGWEREFRASPDWLGGVF